MVMDHAIVIKNYFPKKNKVTMLHERFGKINLYIHEKHPAARLCNGSFIYCHVIKKESSYQCDVIDPYYVPVEDLYFIHDILKICLDFMPDQMPMEDVFDLIVLIYEQYENISSCQKKIFLLKLFLYVGVFPENKKLYQHVMQDTMLHTHDSDILLQQALHYCWTADSNYS